MISGSNHSYRATIMLIITRLLTISKKPEDVSDAEI